MQYTTILLSALAATSSLAAPARRQVSTQVIDNSIRVGLSNERLELGSGTDFEEAYLPQTKRPVGSSGPFDTVTLALGADTSNAALRCQLLDAHGMPIVLNRGNNTEITFADGGKAAPWSFRDGEAEVSSITCDATFVKGLAVPPPPPPPSTNEQQEDLTIRIQLSDGNLARQTSFDDAGLMREEQDSPDATSLFNSVSLTLGADLADQELRCQILDAWYNPITLQRGENIDTTFADGGNGPWSFLEPMVSQVSRIVCDPAFVKASA